MRDKDRVLVFRPHPYTYGFIYILRKNDISMPRGGIARRANGAPRRRKRELSNVCCVGTNRKREKLGTMRHLFLVLLNCSGWKPRDYYQQNFLLYWELWVGEQRRQQAIGSTFVPFRYVCGIDGQKLLTGVKSGLSWLRITRPLPVKKRPFRLEK